jgi:hypothetical protein
MKTEDVDVKYALHVTGRQLILVCLLALTQTLYAIGVFGAPNPHGPRQAWTAIAAAAISAIGSYLASRKANKKSGTQKTLEQQQLEILKQLQPFGTNLLNQSTDTLRLPMTHYSRLAGGNRNAALQELSPEINALDESDRSSLGSIAELAPRGGGSSDFLSRMPFRRNAQTQGLLFGARTDAMDKLATLGQNERSAGLNALGGAQGGGMGLLNFGLNSNNQQFTQGSATGAGIYNILQGFFDSYNRNKQNAGTNSNPYGTQGGTPAGTDALGGWGTWGG